jgi:hypothetical protein
VHLAEYGLLLQAGDLQLRRTVGTHRLPIIRARRDKVVTMAHGAKSAGNGVNEDGE